MVGITGSVGKTTTKDVIAAVLSHPDARPVVGTVFKNLPELNNNRGLPLTEYAAADDSDMAWLVSLVQPSVAVVTAIGPAHLEYFRTVERIAEAKSALVRGVDPAGLVVLSADNAYASGMQPLAPARVVKVPGRGRVLRENTARAVADFLGIPGHTIDAALAEKIVVRGRLDVHDLDGVTLIDDSFNASPLSMQLGLDTLAEWHTTGRKVAILGHMAELGAESVRYHEEIGAYAHSRADLIVGVGLHAPHYRPHHWFPTADAYVSHLPALLARGDVVYVKGSHSVHLVRVVAAIKQRCQHPAAVPA